MVDPRYYFRTASPTFVPFIEARGAWLRESATVGGVDLSATGWAFGGTGGILFALGPSVGIETGASFTAVSFGDADADGTTIPESSASGASLGVFAGLVVYFPSGGGN